MPEEEVKINVLKRCSKFQEVHDSEAKLQQKQG